MCDGCRTKLYYQFFAEAVDTDEKFERQIDALLREVGDRGKVKTDAAWVSEGVPPAPTPAPAPAPVFASIPARVPAVAPVATPPRSAALAPVASADQGVSPSMQMVPTQQSSVESSSAMVERLLDQQREMMREHREEAKADRAEMEARLEAQAARMEARLAKQAKSMQAKDDKIAELMAPAPEAISDEQVALLQARLEGLHVAKLLADEVRTASIYSV